jgi:hypothetical protein
MKKLLTILTLTFLALTVGAQWKTETDGLDLTDLTSTDSVYVFYYDVFEVRRQIYSGKWSVSVDDESVTSDSIYSSIGVAEKVGEFRELTITNWPYELSTDSTTTHNDGYTHGRAAEGDIIPFRYLCVKYYLTNGTVDVAEDDSVSHKVYMFKE